MPFTFGSFGDIVALCVLIKDVVAALDDCRGSAHSFQQLIKQLQVLEVVLHEIQTIVDQNESCPQLQALRSATIHAAANCRGVVEPFLAGIRSYQLSLGPGGSGSSLRDTVRKAQWQVIKKKDVDKFLMDIVATTSTMQTLVSLWTCTTNERRHSETLELLSAAESEGRASRQGISDLLTCILSRVEDSVDMLRRTECVLRYVFSTANARWLQNYGRRLVSSTSRIQACTFDTYNAVLAINTKLTLLTTEYLLSGSSFTLIDALGRRMPMHLQTINSWGALETILEYRFREQKGHRKVVAGDFALKDSCTGQPVHRARPWDGAVKSRQVINMEMIFHNKGVRPKDFTCPRCSSSPGQEVENYECASCGLTYSAVTETFPNTARSSAVQQEALHHNNEQGSQATSIVGPCPPPTLQDEDEDNDDHPRFFERVSFNFLRFEMPRSRNSSAFPEGNYYECALAFLDCRFTATDFDDWKVHCMAHFHPHEPPRSFRCPIEECLYQCGPSKVGHEAWSMWLNHLASHGHDNSATRPDVELIKFLFKKKIISNKVYMRLRSTTNVREQVTLRSDERGRQPRFRHTLIMPSYTDRREKT